MDCRDVERLIDAYLDRELSAEAASEWAAHLADCDACQEQFGGLITLLRSPADVSVPAGLRDRIITALDKQGAHATSTGPYAGRSERPGRRFAWASWTGAVAASLVFFIMGWVASQFWQGPAQTTIVEQPVEMQPDEPVTVVLSPWLVSSWVQANTVRGPANPAAFLAQAVVAEMLVEPPEEEEPMIRVYRPPSDETAPEEDSDLPPPAIQLLPLVPRYLGA